MFISYVLFAMTSVSYGSDSWIKPQKKIMQIQWRCEIRRVDVVVSEYY